MLDTNTFNTVPDSPKEIGISVMLFSFNGRIKRQDWWIWSIIIGILGFIYSFIVGFIAAIIFFEDDFMWATTVNILLLPTWYIGLAIHMKRLQDTGKSWEWLSLAVLSYILLAINSYMPLGSSEENLILNISFILILPIWIICGFVEGTHGPNKFGPDSIERQSGSPQSSFGNSPENSYSSGSDLGSVNTSELKALGDLRSSGIITEAEFQEQKDKILGNR